MPRTLHTGASGMGAQQFNVDVLANNIANATTTGFKRQMVNFEDLFYTHVKLPGQQAADLGRTPTGIEVGNGVRVSSTPHIMEDGPIQQTGVQTHMAIEGDGFFEVLLPDASLAYSRAGDFSLDVDGNFVTSDGFLLQPAVVIPDGTQQISIGNTGVVSVLLSDGTQQDVGQITLGRFQNPQGLIAIGRNLWRPTESSGTVQTGNPGDIGYGFLRQGALEQSNVEVVTELVDMIVAQRTYELNSKSVQTGDEMMQTALEIAR